MRRGEASAYHASGSNVYQDENGRLHDVLMSKVTDLKSVAIEIGTEVRQHNRMLEEMDTDFDSAGSQLGTAMGKVRHLARRHVSSKLLGYMALFSLAVFLVLYWFSRL